MHLVELIIPLRDNEKHRFAREHYDLLREELAGQFGGVSAFVNSPAIGAWNEGGASVLTDEVVVFEVMVEHLDHERWRSYRTTLEARFRQKELVIGAQQHPSDNPGNPLPRVRPLR